MISKIFAIRDNKVSSYLRPFVEANEIQAVRGLTSAVNAPDKNQIKDYPEDFDLYLLGTLDDITGKITPEEPPKFIMAASSVKRPTSKEA